MRNTSILFLLIVSLSCTNKGWEIVWQDEFDSETLDVSKWTAYVGDGCPELCGFGNNELQYYSDRPGNVRIEDGKLIIEAHNDSLGNRAYSSAKLVTKGKADWQYGRFEVRAKIPGGKGNWPAIWMLPRENKYGGWPRSGEIDIMETVGYAPGMVHGTVHTQSFNHMYGTQKGDSTLVSDFDENFHVYSVEWFRNRIDFFIDGERYHSFDNTGKGADDWPFDHPFYLILNVAIGGSWGGKNGIANDIFPNRMEIDYVRVYELVDSE
ncbi:glycoside hydrolase [Roseivirga misakiensis]|uniref:Glycoside hydrolase n=1 Tax=Roseivirga misakiensis TaxID=1563681 RepID=A0A1E5T2V3_9BACT|nr:glycoside hydrolase [Roseivirga misakiensis]